MTTRRPAVAGVFYPAGPDRLRSEVERLLSEAGPQPGHVPAAMLQPHAGYGYSGPVAATGYRRLADSSATPDRVVVLCPNHTVPLAEMAVPETDEWETPLGVVPVDGDLRSSAVSLDGVIADDRPHRAEHAVEVHLPFLQSLLEPGWSVLPVVVGEVVDRDGSALVDAMLAAGALVVISSDLSHYLPHDVACRRDAATIRAVIDRDVDSIGPYDACGRHALRALLASTGIIGLTPEVLDVRTSADTAGDPGRTVGYASVVWG